MGLAPPAPDAGRALGAAPGARQADRPPPRRSRPGQATPAAVVQARDENRALLFAREVARETRADDSEGCSLALARASRALRAHAKEVRRRAVEDAE